MLSYADSNHDKQKQNLLCYHYTIGQSRNDCLMQRYANPYSEFATAKVRKNNGNVNVNVNFFYFLFSIFNYLTEMR